MSKADDIREFVLAHYVQPARADRRSEIIVRAGDIHAAMRLANAMPSVCSAIGASKFEEFAGVTTLKRLGPSNGANAVFHFRIGEGLPITRATTLGRAERAKETCESIVAPLSFDSALVFVSCVKSKLSHPVEARALYTSLWFVKVRELVEAAGAHWFILSALYGIVSPNAKIAPYDHTLNRLGIAERQAWADRVLEVLLPKVVEYRQIIIFAGSRYREFLVEPLRQTGKDVVIPMEGLRQGEQLEWFNSADESPR